MDGFIRRSLQVVTISALLVVSVAASQPQPVECDQSAGPTGCIDVTLSPAELLGDIYLDGQVVVGQSHSTRLHVTPDTTHMVEVKNISSPTVGFGDLFVYDDASQAGVRVRTGSTLYWSDRFTPSVVVRSQADQSTKPVG